MTWLFRKSKKIGPVKVTVSKKGLGTSIGFLGFRVGVSTESRSYWSFGIPGTGFYYIKYYGKAGIVTRNMESKSSQSSG